MNIRATQVCTWILGLVGDDAAHKVRLSAAQVSHQLVQVLLYLHTKTVFSSKCILFKAVFLKSWWHYLYIYFSDLFSAPFLITLVQLTLCNCETVWKEAAFLLLSLVSDFGSPAETTTNNAGLLWARCLCFPDSVCLAKYPCQSWCSSQTVRPSVCWRISGTEPPPSHSEGLCSYPASRWYCTAPTVRYRPTMIMNWFLLSFSLDRFNSTQRKVWILLSYPVVSLVSIRSSPRLRSRAPSFQYLLLAKTMQNIIIRFFIYPLNFLNFFQCVL